MKLLQYAKFIEEQLKSANKALNKASNKESSKALNKVSS